MGTRPIRAGAEGKLSARQILKGHPFCEIRPDRVKHELTNYLQERYDQGVLLFDLRGAATGPTVDICSGGDRGKGVFTQTLSCANQENNQSRGNQLIVAKADQKDTYIDLHEIIGPFAAAFTYLEATGIPLTAKVIHAPSSRSENLPSRRW